MPGGRGFPSAAGEDVAGRRLHLRPDRDPVRSELGPAPVQQLQSAGRPGAAAAAAQPAARRPQEGAETLSSSADVMSEERRTFQTAKTAKIQLSFHSTNSNNAQNTEQN